MLNRTIMPTGQAFNYIPLPKYKEIHLKNGIPVYLLSHGTVGVCEVQALFRAGSSFEQKTGVSDIVVKMLSEGTEKYDSVELADVLDDFGASLENEVGNEYISVSVVGLSHLLNKTLPILEQVVFHPSFPEEEFLALKSRRLQKLEVKNQKSAFIAAQKFPGLLFGTNHPYGASTNLAELQAIELEDVKKCHQDYFHTGNLKLTVIGNFDEAEVIKSLNEVFGELEMFAPFTELPKSKTEPIHTTKGRFHFPLKGVQSTVRVGHLGLTREHEDAAKMELVNLILGGYFGSRLMKNIREEKGYTYGIYSQWINYSYSGVFYISADVGNEYVEATIEEIKKEIQLLIDKGLSKEELELVKNYKYGKSINDRETPFQMAKLLRFSLMTGLSFAEMDKRYHDLAAITCEEVQSLTAKHFHLDQLLEVVAGKDA